jgi:hypothetical protein
MKHVVASIALVAMMGCQAPEDASIRLAADESAFVSDDPCGWDDPLNFHANPEVGRHYARCDYEDNGGEELETLVLRSYGFSIQEDGTADFYHRQQVFGDITEDHVAGFWERIEGSCLISVKDENGDEITKLGNPRMANEARAFLYITPHDSTLQGFDDGAEYNCIDVSSSND